MQSPVISLDKDQQAIAQLLLFNTSSDQVVNKGFESQLSERQISKWNDLNQYNSKHQQQQIIIFEDKEDYDQYQSQQSQTKTSCRPVKKLQMNCYSVDNKNVKKNEQFMQTQKSEQPSNVFQFNQFLKTNYTMRQKYMRINGFKTEYERSQFQSIEAANSVNQGFPIKRVPILQNIRSHSVKIQDKSNMDKGMFPFEFKSTQEPQYSSSIKYRQVQRRYPIAQSKHLRKRDESQNEDLFQMNRIPIRQTQTPGEITQGHKSPQSNKSPLASFILYPCDDNLIQQPQLVRQVIDLSIQNTIANYNQVRVIQEFKFQKSEIPCTPPTRKRNKSQTSERLFYNLNKQLTYRSNAAFNARSSSQYSCNKKKYNDLGLFSSYQILEKSQNSKEKKKIRNKISINTSRFLVQSTINGIKLELQNRKIDT